MPTPPESLYREISLTRGQVAIVDATDYEWLAQWKWYAAWHPKRGLYYAQRIGERSNGKQPRSFFSMHRVILGLTSSDLHGDHIDHDTLNNRRSNLRVATRSQNASNRKLNKNSKTGYKGVREVNGKFVAMIHAGPVYKWLGTFPDPISAHEAYCRAATESFGEFAWLHS
jgi:hypothetical protein